MNDNFHGTDDKSAFRIAYLVAGFLRGTISESEHDELDEWINASDENMKLFEELTDEKNLEANLEWMDKTRLEQSYHELKERGAFNKTANTVPLKKILMVAASIAMAVCLYFIYRYTSSVNVDITPIVIADTAILKPGGNKATLQLADGSIIDLTNAKIGSIHFGEGSHVDKPADGELVYEARGTSMEVPANHTLSTPVGGQYRLTLSDGTKVWLNAATSLKYPSQFAGRDRVVEIQGEAFFEVAKNAQKPFKVILPDSTTVNVIGTHFNVMSYGDEEDLEVALLEGRVNVVKGSNAQILEPGTLARISGNSIKKIRGVDTAQIIGWKEGLFVFHDAPIEAIMRQIERWYDAKVVFKGVIRHRFNATIYRSEPLSKLLRLLELNGYVKFRTEGKTVYVFP